MDFPAEMLKNGAESIVLYGGAAMALFYGVKRVYNTARNVEKLVEKAEQNDTSNKEYRKKLKEDLDAQDASRNEKLAVVTDGLNTLAAALQDHIKIEEQRDIIRDRQMIQMTDHIDEMVKEMRPNGGSSMKDIINLTSKKVDEVHTRVAVLEQWKNDKTPSVPLKKVASKRKRK
jgi:hypothetical protein